MECNYKNTINEQMPDECFHMHVLIDPVETHDGANNIIHMCRYICQDCGKVVAYCKDLNYENKEVL